MIHSTKFCEFVLWSRQYLRYWWDSPQNQSCYLLMRLPVVLGETQLPQGDTKSEGESLFITCQAYITCCCFQRPSRLQFFSSSHCSLWSTYTCVLTVPLTNQGESCLRAFVFAVAFLECSFTVMVLSLFRHCSNVISTESSSLTPHPLLYCLLYLSSKNHSYPCQTHTHTAMHTCMHIWN